MDGFRGGDDHPLGRLSAADIERASNALCHQAVTAAGWVAAVALAAMPAALAAAFLVLVLVAAESARGARGLAVPGLAMPFLCGACAYALAAESVAMADIGAALAALATLSMNTALILGLFVRGGLHPDLDARLARSMPRWIRRWLLSLARG